MQFNYNLIIIGINKLGLIVAEYALKLGARVAIIDYSHQCYDSSFFYQLNSDNVFNIRKIIEQENKLIENRLNDLRLLGLDIIYHQYFSINYNQKKINIATKNYQLIAPVSIITISPQLPLKLEQNQVNKKEISSIIIKGNTSEAIYLSQQLLSLDKPIHLITKNQSLLPQEDEDISWNLQLSLEAKGVKIFNQYSLPLDRFNAINNENQLILETAEDNREIPKCLDNNLDITWRNNQIIVNKKLQTNNIKFYACGEILGGYNLDNLNEYEAKIAVNNSLFFPVKTVNYSQFGYTLNTNPPLYRIGYTEKQVSLLYHNSFYIIKLFVNFNYNQDSNFIKLILSNDDYILGFHGLGENLLEIFNSVCYILINNYQINYLFNSNFNQKYSYQIVKKIEEKCLEEHKRQNQIIINIRSTLLLWKRI